MKFLVPKIVDQWRLIFREGGLKLLIRKKGLKVLVAFFSFYLVRDVLLYVIIPYLAIKGIISCPSSQ